MLIRWSDEEHAFLVFLPEWEDLASQPVADGQTYEEAAREGAEALELLIDVAKERGQELPRPHVAASV
jgi:predicted RNase H-like HicB family nuclease